VPVPAAPVRNTPPELRARSRRRAIALVLAAGAALLVGPPVAQACLEVGVYQDNPVRTLPALKRAVGPGVSTLTVYVTAGKTIDAKTVAFIKGNKLRVIVTWLPDNGSNGTNKPKFRLALIAKGKLDKGLKTLAKQMAGLRTEVLFRPMPEPNTPWYSWSGTENKNRAADYVKAWKRVRLVVRKAAGADGAKRIKFLWTPYARSIPDTPANALTAYFPGVKQVDQVGASAYNFGQTPTLAWSDPDLLFAGAYSTLQALAPGKPFWIAETASTAKGGDKAGWIAQLAGLQAAFPALRGIVWYDVMEPTGDFRVRPDPAVIASFRKLLAGRCK
jgi:Glycosyl hydrolase family 26